MDLSSASLPAQSQTMSCDGGQDLSLLSSSPTSGTWPITLKIYCLVLFDDNITLTCEDLPLLQDTLQALLEPLQRRRWE